MAARTWFRIKECEELTTSDCRVLNTATRIAFPPSTEPRRLELMSLRMAYKKGMSALDLLTATGYEF